MIISESHAYVGPVPFLGILNPTVIIKNIKKKILLMCVCGLLFLKSLGFTFSDILYTCSTFPRMQCAYSKKFIKKQLHRCVLPWVILSCVIVFQCFYFVVGVHGT